MLSLPEESLKPISMPEISCVVLIVICHLQIFAIIILQSHVVYIFFLYMDMKI